MEPQLEGCGKLLQILKDKGEYGLQWSRNLRVAERPRPACTFRVRTGFNGAAT